MFTGPPNADEAPNPTSSSNTINTFGAPCGGRKRSIGGNDVPGSVAANVVKPGTGRSGIGNTSRGRSSRPTITLTSQSETERNGTTTQDDALARDQRLM